MPSLQAFRLLETCLGVSLFQLVLGLSLAMRGFHKASERFASAGSSADDAFRALFECVAWAGTINERLRERGNSSPELQGLWFVRNRVIHGGADALRSVMVSGGAMLGAAVLGSFALGEAPTYGWQWQPSSMLPTGRSQAGVEDYEKHPQGRDVAATLKAVSAHLQKTNVG
jgi:hypothetical protein